jgi:pSer/pThr/pTyr-binding forkhead associated (FHA) protein
MVIFLRDTFQRELLLDKPFYTIGRGRICDIAVDEDCVSRKHCQVVLKNGKYHLVDDGSRNGTYINGERVGSIPHLLQDGDEISLGITGKDISHRIVFQHIKNHGEK